MKIIKYFLYHNNREKIYYGLGDNGKLYFQWTYMGENYPHKYGWEESEYPIDKITAIANQFKDLLPFI